MYCLADHILCNFVFKLSSDTALTTPAGRLFQSFTTHMLKKCLFTLFLANGFFSLNLCILVIEVLSTLHKTFSNISSPWRILNTWIMSPLIRRYFMLGMSTERKRSGYEKFGILVINFDSRRSTFSFSSSFTFRSGYQRPRKTVVFFPEIGFLKKNLSVTRPHSRMCIRIYNFNFKKHWWKENAAAWVKIFLVTDNKSFFFFWQDRYTILQM